MVPYPAQCIFSTFGKKHILSHGNFKRTPPPPQCHVYPQEIGGLTKGLLTTESSPYEWIPMILKHPKLKLTASTFQDPNSNFLDKAPTCNWWVYQPDFWVFAINSMYDITSQIPKIWMFCLRDSHGRDKATNLKGFPLGTVDGNQKSQGQPPGMVVWNPIK